MALPLNLENWWKVGHTKSVIQTLKLRCPVGKLLSFVILKSNHDQDEGQPAIGENMLSNSFSEKLCSV